MAENMGRWRVEVKPGAARTDDVFLHLIQLSDQAVARMIDSRVSEKGQHIELAFTVGEHIHTIRLNKTGDVGGHIRIDEGGKAVVDTEFPTSITALKPKIELDIFRTKDGKIVVIHDRTTGRVGDRDLVVPEATYEQLLAVDVAADFRRRQGKSSEAVPKHAIPLLEDVLRLAMTQNRTRVSIQPKMDCVADAIALVRELGAERWIGFNDGNLPLMAEVKLTLKNRPAVGRE